MPRRRHRRDWNVNRVGHDDENDMQLQEALFNSIHNLDHNDVKKKGVDVSCRLVKTNGRINIANSIRERGESSCIYCTICNEPRSVANSNMKGGNCGHVFCEECIVNYVRERIKEDIREVNCPVSNCKEKFEINEYLVPDELMDQWRDAVHEAKVLATCDIIECPFWDCSGNLVDDKKGFLTRACPKCWRIFCVRCKVGWHMGIKCETYQLQRKLRPLSRLFMPKKDDDDDDQKGKEKVLSIDEFLKLF